MGNKFRLTLIIFLGTSIFLLFSGLLPSHLINVNSQTQLNEQEIYLAQNQDSQSEPVIKCIRWCRSSKQDDLLYLPNMIIPGVDRKFCQLGDHSEIVGTVLYSNSEIKLEPRYDCLNGMPIIPD